MADNKDTIYIDIDDEITSIIDKVRGSSSKVVALVLPKRASTLQSIVNMKLLKRAAEDGSKNLVLVTTESGLLPLAGAVGLHVASTPNSRPEIPSAPGGAGGVDNAEESIDLLGEEATDPLEGSDGDKTIGELADATMPLPGQRPAGIETVELDNADDETPKVAAAAGVMKGGPKPKKDKKLHIPDFDRFRLVLILGGVLLVVLVVFGYLAIVVLPKATINIKTNASNVNTNVDFTLSTSATDFRSGSKTVPAKRVQTQKTLTGTANASGQQNNGDKASGSVDMTICTNSPSATGTLPAGTAVISGKSTYVTQQSAGFQYAGNCSNGFRFRANDVNIRAQSAGASANTGDNASFSVSGRSDISASGSASGGSDNIQTVVTQADIDSATGKISSSGDNEARSDLNNQLQGQGLYAIAATFSDGTPSTTTSSKAGDAASSVTVTQTITYSELGANQDDLNSLVDTNIKSQIDTGKQSILSRGITQGAFKQKSASTSGASMNLQTTAEVGPDINTDDIAQNAAGKKSGDIKADIKNNPDVTDVDVKLSPFWVSHAPKNVNKITVSVAKPTSGN